MARMLSEAVSAFTKNGVACAHVRFRDEHAPAPYATIYLNDGTSPFRSDDRNSRTLSEYDFILHVRDRDLALEASIEDALGDAEIGWGKSGGYDADRDLLTITYNMQVYER